MELCVTSDVHVSYPKSTNAYVTLEVGCLLRLMFTPSSVTVYHDMSGHCVLCYTKDTQIVSKQ